MVKVKSIEEWVGNYCISTGLRMWESVGYLMDKGFDRKAAIEKALDHGRNAVKDVENIEGLGLFFKDGNGSIFKEVGISDDEAKFIYELYIFTMIETMGERGKGRTKDEQLENIAVKMGMTVEDLKSTKGERNMTEGEKWAPGEFDILTQRRLMTVLVGK